MKSRSTINLPCCLFCGSEVDMSHGTLNLPIYLFKCKNFKHCGAVVSFDNPATRISPDNAINFWRMRRNEGSDGRKDDIGQNGEA